MREASVVRVQGWILVSTWLLMLGYAGFAHTEVTGHGVIRAPDDFLWSPLTILMCLVGWFLSWGSEWATEYMSKRKCFTKFAIDHLPRLLISLVSTFAVYALLPDLGHAVGYEIKFGNLGAFVCGLAADFIVQRIRAFTPKRDGAPPPEAGGP